MTYRFILPLLGEYVDSGYRTPKDRMIYSLKSNGQYYGIVFGLGIVGAVYAFIQNGFNGQSLKSLIMALAYFVGLVQAIYLMGHGLVAIPRRLFRNASAQGRLRRLQTEAPKMHEKLEDASMELQDLDDQLAQLRQRKTGMSSEYQEWIEELVDTTYNHSRAVPIAPHNIVAAVPAIVTDRYLAELGRKLMRARHKRVRFLESWNYLVQKAAQAQSIIDASVSQRLDSRSSGDSNSFLRRFTSMTPFIRYQVHGRILPGIRIFHGAFFALASICIVWSELIKSAAPSLSIIGLTVVHHSNSDEGKVGFAGQVIATLWMLYMCTATMVSFKDVRVWGNRALVRRNTYAESACWYSGQVAKLTVPLTYNFLTFMPPDIHTKTTFYRFLGNLIDLTPLGKWFNILFPCFILIPICATLFNLYGRVKKLLGFSLLEDDDDPTGYGAGGWREGRDLIERELSGRCDLESATLLGDSPDDASGSSHSTNARSTADRTPRMYIPPYNRTYSAQRQTQRLSAATQAAEEEDETVFSGFAHRLRNTLEQVETPDWFRDLGTRPKWMGGVDGNTETSGRADSGRGLGRWFGGRPADGRVRL